MENAIATIIVAVIGLIGIIIQTKSHNKLKKQETILEEVDLKIDAFKKESKEDDANLNRKLDETRLQTLKIWLTTELTKVRDGIYKPNEEQKRLLIEAKREYNRLGGDSYVDDMFDECKEKHLF